MVIDVPHPETVGDDLVVMNAYAWHLFERDMIIVSIGTVTVINYISAEGHFKYCILAPGFYKVAETLYGNAAKLPRFEMQMTDSFLANDTLSAMNVGAYKGFVGMLEYLVNGMKKEVGGDPLIVGCGGVGKKIHPYTAIFDYYEPDLVSKGLNYIYERGKQ